MPLAFDLQSHSRCSDGELGPADVVARAAAAGVELLALSDHDTLDGVERAREAASEQGIALASAVEISALDRSGADHHILGYCIDIGNRRLREVLALARADRGARADRIAGRLVELDFEPDEALIDEHRSSGASIGRPHLAAAVVAHPGNAERLRAEGLRSLDEFFDAYLTPGSPAFEPRAAPDVPGAIELIHGAGGVAVWAHPFWDVHEPDAVLETLARYHEAGIDGVEVFYTTHTEEQTRLLHARAKELGLLATGSSDFHGPGHARFNAFLAHELYGLEPELGPIAASL